jgi:hypothetical protein
MAVTILENFLKCKSSGAFYQAFLMVVSDGDKPKWIEVRRYGRSSLIDGGGTTQVIVHDFGSDAASSFVKITSDKEYRSTDPYRSPPPESVHTNDFTKVRRTDSYKSIREFVDVHALHLGRGAVNLIVSNATASGVKAILEAEEEPAWPSAKAAPPPTPEPKRSADWGEWA